MPGFLLPALCDALIKPGITYITTLIHKMIPMSVPTTIRELIR